MRGWGLKKLTIGKNVSLYENSVNIMLPFVALVKSVKLISGSVTKLTYLDENFNYVRTDSISVVACQEVPVNKVISGFQIPTNMVMEIYL